MCVEVGCGGVILGCGVRDLAGSTLSSCSWFDSFFSFWKWFEGKLGDGFWTMGRHNLGRPELGWAGRSLAEVSLDMGFGLCEECARAFSLQV